MMYNSYFPILGLVVFATALFSAMVIPYIVKYSFTKKFFDVPDGKRKIHKHPVPRLGGLGFFPISILVFAVFMLIAYRADRELEHLWNISVIQHLLSFLVGGLILYVCGIIDDRVGVSYKVKFVVQVIAAVSLCVGGLWVADFGGIFGIHGIPYWIGMPLTILMTVYVTNAVNLIDGIDGLASGIACFALLVIAVLFVCTQQYVWALFCAAYLGSVAVFFYYNVFSNKYKVFMGDTGSLSLGFALNFLILHFWQDSPAWAAEVPNAGVIALSTLAIPLIDVVRVFVSRLRRGCDPFMPDRNHIHHKLMKAGLSANKTMMVIIIAAIAMTMIVSAVCL